MNAALVVLVLTIVTPREKPDIRHVQSEPSIEQCWKDAADFVAHGIPEAVPNALGVMAACMEQRGAEHKT